LGKLTKVLHIHGQLIYHYSWKKERKGKREGGKKGGRKGGREKGREGGRKEGRKMSKAISRCNLFELIGSLQEHNLMNTSLRI
jgi:hypothetical protein